MEGTRLSPLAGGRCAGSPPPSPEVRFNMILHCSPENTRTERELVLAEMPATVQDLKLHIQTHLQIPVCCQTLFFESVPLDDCETLHFYRIHDNDTLQVHFTSKADVDDVMNIITTLRDIVPFLDSIQSELSMNDIHSPDLDLRVSRAVKSRNIESLACKYFYPSATERAEANRRLFITNRGLEVMHEVHTLLLRQPWRKLPIELQYLEHAILRNLWNITAAFSVREQVLKRPTLSAVMQSMLRVTVENGMAVSTPCDKSQRTHAMAQELDRIVCEVVYKAVGTMCNCRSASYPGIPALFGGHVKTYDHVLFFACLPKQARDASRRGYSYSLAEIPRCRLAIASSPTLLRQLVAVMLTPSYKYIAPLVTIAGFLCLAYSPETHQFLAAPEVVEGVMEACEMKRPWCRTLAKEIALDRMLLRYFATMFFAQLVSSSLEYIPRTFQDRISIFMDDFLQTADYREVRKHEVLNGYIWSTLVPFIKLVYLPHRQGSGLSKLQELCIEAGVFSLQNMLSGEEGQAVLVQEGLVEYVTCMPWHIPEGLVAQGRARDLVSEQCQKLQLQPPRLSSLTRAKLAVEQFGLVRMLEVVSVQELLADPAHTQHSNQWSVCVY